MKDRKFLKLYLQKIYEKNTLVNFTIADKHAKKMSGKFIETILNYFQPDEDLSLAIHLCILIENMVDTNTSTEMIEFLKSKDVLKLSKVEEFLKHD